MGFKMSEIVGSDKWILYLPNKWALYLPDKCRTVNIDSARFTILALKMRVLLPS